MKSFVNQLSQLLSHQLLPEPDIAPPPFDSRGRPKGRGRVRWLETLLFVTSLLVSSRVSHAAAITWTNGGGGNWSAPANWSPNEVPGSSDDVLITSNGTYLVTLDTSPTINSLTLGADSGEQTLTNQDFTLTLNSASIIGTNGNAFRKFPWVLTG